MTAGLTPTHPDGPPAVHGATRPAPAGPPAARARRPSSGPAGPTPAGADLGADPARSAGVLAGLPEGEPATGPAEARGLARDEVRMLVASASEGLRQVPARALPAVLRPGDLLVLNTSDALPAALRGVTAAGEPVAVHLSTVDPAGGREPADALRSRESRWVVEIRRPSARLAGEPSTVDRAGTVIAGHGARVTVDRSYVPGHRLWTARVQTPAPLLD